MPNSTTIQIRTSTKEKLQQLKLSQSETFDEVIENLIEDTLDLTEEAKRDIEEALEDVKNGVSLEVPEHLKDASYAGAKELGHGKGYIYTHDDPEKPQEFLKEKRTYYRRK